MTLNHYAYNIRNIGRAGQGNSDDDTLGIRQVKFWVNAWRAVGVLQRTEYGKHIDPQLVQDLGCVPLVTVDISDPNVANSECLCPEYGCTIKKIILPKLVDFPYNRGIVFVGKLDKRTPFIIDSADTTVFKESTQFGSLLTRVYMIGNTMYIKLSPKDKGLKYINVRGVFEDPSAVSSYVSTGCSPICHDDAVDEYPMPLSMYDFVTKNILMTELNMTLSTAEDELNNAKSEKGVETPIKG